MIRHLYPNPPIVEAVIELRFNADISLDVLLETMSDKLSARYPGPRKIQEQINLSASIDEGSIKTSGSRSTQTTFLSSNNGLRLLGCGTRMISVHVLAPYPGWEGFIEQLEEAVDALPNSVQQIGFQGLSVRYIDRITFPIGASSFVDYLTIMPPKPDPMSSNISRFHQMIQTVDPETGNITQLVLATPPPTPEGATTLIFDLSIQRQEFCTLEKANWLPILETLHQQLREIFEASITDKMRALFQ